MDRSKWKGILYVLLGSASYGVLSPVVKLAYEAGWSEPQVTLMQVGIGALLLWLLVLMQPSTWSNPLRGPWVRLSITGVFGLTGTTFLYNKALAGLDATIAIVLLFQFTWLTIIVEAIATRTWPRRNQWIAIVLVWLGTALSVRLLDADWSRLSAEAIAYGLGSACTYSFFIWMLGRTQTDMHPMLKSAVTLTLSVPLICILFPPMQLLEGTGGSMQLVSLVGWGLLIGLLGQVLPTMFMSAGLPRTGSSLGSILGSFELPVGILAAFVILGEAVQPLQWFGMLLIVAGIIVSER